jgi:fumarate hydratase class II
MDATLLTVGQEWSGYAAALGSAGDGIRRASHDLLEVALGGTAVGTGLNAPPGFTEAATAALSESTGYAFRPAANPFAAQATLDALVRAHGAIKAAAVTLFKIANDLRWLASGPRAGLQELRIPVNEPGSTVMPGKVNPTQAEATLMACLTVIGHDQTVAMAGAEGNFELNAFRPIVIDEYLRSVRLLSDASDSLRTRLVNGAALNGEQIHANVDRSVMVVTALTPVIGYDRAAAIVKRAVESELSVRDAALLSGMDARMYDALVRDAARSLASGVPPT